MKKILIFKITMADVFDRAPHNPSRIIAVPENQKLFAFAKTILDSFNFCCDHAFGFYSNINPDGNPYASDVIYELFADMEDDDMPSYFKGVRYGVKKMAANKAFPEIGKKLLFKFDYGDDWNFIIELKSIEETKPRLKYPRIIEKNGRAPRQY